MFFQEGSETAVTIAVAILLLLRQLYGSRRILCLDHVEQKVSVKCFLLERAVRSSLVFEIFSVLGNMADISQLCDASRLIKVATETAHQIYRLYISCLSFGVTTSPS